VGRSSRAANTSAARRLCAWDARTKAHAKKQRRKENRDGEIRLQNKRYGPFTWGGPLRGAVLLGRKDERSEASLRVGCADKGSRKEAKTQRKKFPCW